MASITASYPTSGGFRTDVSGAPGTNLGGGQDMGWLMDLAKRRAAQKTRQGEYDLMAQREALKQATAQRNPLATTQAAYGTPMDQAVQREAGLANIAQSRAISGTAPQKFISLGMGEGGYMPDDRMMTGAQRQAFLPQNSQFTGEPTPLDIERGTAAGIRGQQGAEQQGIRELLAMLAGTQPGYGSLR